MFLVSALLRLNSLQTYRPEIAPAKKCVTFTRLYESVSQ
nr:MAG TPA: hypothetical protein [Caudoviricetes sp.]